MPPPPPPFNRNSAAALAGVLLVALAVRLVVWKHHPIVSVDGTTYIRLARHLLGGPFIDTQQPPGYPALIAIVLSFVSGNGVLAARVVDLVFGVALLVPFFLLLRSAFGLLSATLGSIVLALTPLMIRYSVTTMSEAPYTFFIVLAVLAAWHRRDLLAGALGGAAFLVRPEGAVLVGALALARGLKPRSWLLLAAGFAVAGAGPALLFNHHATGRWILTRKVVNITGDDLRANEAAQASREGTAELSVAERLRDNTGAIRRGYPGRLWAEVENTAHAIGWPFVVASAAGLALAPALPAAGLAQALAVPLFPGVPPVARLVIPLLPFVIFLGLALVRKLGESSWRGRAVLFVLLAGWAAAAAREAPSLDLHEDGYYPELVDAGVALSTIVADTNLVFDRKPYTAFYAGARYQATPLAGYDETLDAIVKAKGDYLVVDESVTEYFRPALLPLVRDSATMLVEPRLDLIYFDGTYRDRHVAIYRVVRPGGPAMAAERERNENLKRMIATRIPHDPARHLVHAELLRRAGRETEAQREEELGNATGLPGTSPGPER